MFVPVGIDSRKRVRVTLLGVCLNSSKMLLEYTRFARKNITFIRNGFQYQSDNR